MNRVNYFLIFLLMIINNDLLAQYHKPDSIALSLIETKFSSNEELVHTLVNDLITDEDKYRAIFRYLIFKVRYNKGLKQMTNLKRKKNYGNCAAISQMYKHLCEAANLPCRYVVGYAKNELLFLVPHAWNIILINNKEYVVDATWSLYPFNTINKKFPYFKADDNLLRYTHFSKDSYFKKFKTSLGKFSKGVLVGDGFIENNNKFLSFEKKYKISLKQLKIIIHTELLEKSTIGLQYKEELYFPLIDKINDSSSALIFNLEMIPPNNSFTLFINNNNRDIKVKTTIFKYLKR